MSSNRSFGNSAHAKEPLTYAQHERINKYTPAQQSRWQKQQYDALLVKDCHPSGFFTIGHSGISLLTGKWEPNWSASDALAKTNLTKKAIEDIVRQSHAHKRESAKTRPTELPVDSQQWRDGSETKIAKKAREYHPGDNLVVTGGNAFSGFTYGLRPQTAVAKPRVVANAPLRTQHQSSRVAPVAAVKPEARKTDHEIAAEAEWKKEVFRWQMGAKKNLPDKENFVKAFLKKRGVVIPKSVEKCAIRTNRISKTPPRTPTPASSAKANSKATLRRKSDIAVRSSKQRRQRRLSAMLEAMEATFEDLCDEGIIDDMVDE